LSNSRCSWQESIRVSYDSPSGNCRTARIAAPAARADAATAGRNLCSPLCSLD
jgi:hypothetical protein